MNNVNYQKDGSRKIYDCLFEKGQKHYLLADEVGLGKTVTAARTIAKIFNEKRKEKRKTGSDFDVKICYICSNQALGSVNIKKLEKKIKEELENNIVIKTRSGLRLSLLWKELLQHGSESNKKGYEYSNYDKPMARAYAYLLKDQNKYTYANFEEHLNKGDVIAKGFKGNLTEKSAKEKLKLAEAILERNYDEWCRLFHSYLPENVEDENYYEKAVEAMSKMTALAQDKGLLTKYSKINPLRWLEVFFSGHITIYMLTPSTTINMDSEGILEERVYSYCMCPDHIKKKLNLGDGIAKGKADNESFNKKKSEVEAILESNKLWKKEFEDNISNFNVEKESDYYKSARKAMVKMSIDKIKMDLYIADEIQNFPEIFESGEKKEGSEASVINSIIGEDAKLLLMSATPFRYKSKLADYENQHKDAYADAEDVADTDCQRYLDNQTHVYDEFKKIIGFLNKDFDFRKWENLNTKKSEYMKKCIEKRDIMEDGINLEEKYIECVKEQSDMLKKSNISRIERYMARIGDMFRTAEDKAVLEWNEIAVREILFSPKMKKDLSFYDDDGELFSAYQEEKITLRRDYIKSTPSFLSFKSGYKSLEDVFRTEGNEVMLRYDKIKGFEQVFASKDNVSDELVFNARIARLFEVIFDEEEQYKLLFIPPVITTEERSLKGVFEGKTGISKRLFFSDYNMTPKSLSAMLSYEASRRVINDLKKRIVPDENGKTEIPTEIPIVPGGERKLDVKKLLEYDYETEDFYKELAEYDANDSTEKCGEKESTDNKYAEKSGSPYTYYQKKHWNYYKNLKKELTKNELNGDIKRGKKFSERYFRYMTQVFALRVILAYTAADNCNSLYEAIHKYGADGCIWDVFNEYAGCLGENDISSSEDFKSMMTAYSGIHPIKVDVPEGSGKDMYVNFALGHYSGDKIEGNDAAKEFVKKITMFNSPFYPFNFISTSIGQEGFDFHQYCRKIVHWSLEYNPVKFEQREGRVNRYHGYAQRLRVAEIMAKESISFKSWPEAFDDIKASEEIKGLPGVDNGLIPDFVLPEMKLEREFYYYPDSYESRHYKDVLNAVGYYRSLLGQSGNDTLEDDFEYFVEICRNKGDSETATDNLEKYFINLYPEMKNKQII